MDNEKNQELKNEIKDSTFIEKGDSSFETISEGPEVSFEEHKADDRVKVETKKTQQKNEPTDESKAEGLGYPTDGENNDSSGVVDYSSANTWRSTLREKKAA